MHIEHRYKKATGQAWKDWREMYAGHALARWSFWASLALLIATVLLPAWRILPLAEQMPFIALHYNVYLGVDRFGPAWHVFYVPLLGFFFMCLNVAAQAVFSRSQKTLALVFASATPLLMLILLAAMALIVLINL